ncbi:hypothetical protein CTAYLR_006153 [Chrysophaeum taylorii]|uniref:NACHT domain-containing protein n=1 Tax=Chrysophaeum taylorii TaxID=2483200 RepID=A0AAD7UPY1_9STRA|nr:hypothetical protein CTAYLR_006153 [Chrysophaeum taylorii]
MLLAPPPAMSTLMQQCLAPDVNGRPTCGEALLEAIELPIAAVSCAAAETDDAAQKLLNIGRAVVELNDVELACRVCRALEATGANSSDMADCYALVACSLFVDVVCQARLYDAKLFALPCTLEKDSVAYLKVTKDEADSARDLVTNDRVSVSKCVRELPPSVVIRSDVKTADSRLEPSPLRIMAGSVPHRIRAALTNVVCSSESVEAAMRTGRVVVEGAAGSGKGWTLRALVVALCENQLDDADSNASQLVFPLTISLASIEDPESDWLGRAIDDAQDHCEVLRLARVERRLVLCLDGLNEITPLTRQSIVKKIVKYSRSCLLTVVTSRPMAGNVDEFAPHGFSFLNIAQVNPKHLEALGLPKKISSLVETPLAFRLALLALFPGGDKEFMARSMKLAQQDGTLAVARDVLSRTHTYEIECSKP